MFGWVSVKGFLVNFGLDLIKNTSKICVVRNAYNCNGMTRKSFSYINFWHSSKLYLKILTFRESTIIKLLIQTI